MKKIIFPLIIVCLFVKLNAQTLPETNSDTEQVNLPQTLISNFHVTHSKNKSLNRIVFYKIVNKFNTSSDVYSYQIFNETESGFLVSNGNLISNSFLVSNTNRSVYEGYLNYTSQGFGFYRQGGYPGIFFKIGSGIHKSYASQSYDLSFTIKHSNQQINGSTINRAMIPFKATMAYFF